MLIFFVNLSFSYLYFLGSHCSSQQRCRNITIYHPKLFSHLFLQWPPNIIHARVRLKRARCFLLVAEKKKRVNGITNPGKKYMYLKEEAQSEESRWKEIISFFHWNFFFFCIRASQVNQKIFDSYYRCHISTNFWLIRYWLKYGIQGKSLQFKLIPCPLEPLNMSGPTNL